VLLEIFLCFLVEFFFLFFYWGVVLLWLIVLDLFIFYFPFFMGEGEFFRRKKGTFIFILLFFFLCFVVFLGYCFFGYSFQSPLGFFVCLIIWRDFLFFLPFLVFFLVEKIFLSFYNFFSFLGFLKFISSRVFSRNFNKFFYWLFDFSWFEILGGGGFYNFFRFLGFSVNNVISFGFKWGVLIGIPFIIWMLSYSYKRGIEVTEYLWHFFILFLKKTCFF